MDENKRIYRLELMFPGFGFYAGHSYYSTVEFATIAGEKTLALKTAKKFRVKEVILDEFLTSALTPVTKEVSIPKAEPASVVNNGRKLFTL